MKIAHVGLAAFFTEGMTYQDNCLSEQNVKDGHEVLYISNASKYVNGTVVETGYEDRIISTGVRLVRLPYRHILNRFFSDKFRSVNGLYALIKEFAPDVIVCHDLCYWSVLDVIRYRKEHPNVKLYADTHTDRGNSGTNWLSMNILHGMYYRWLAQKALPYVESLLYTSYERKDFFMEIYGYPEEKTEFYPLGGVILSNKDYEEKRRKRRNELDITDGELLFIHSGKLDAMKKTKAMLDAFYAVPELHAKLIIAGSVPENMRSVLLPLFDRDSRVQFLGWKNAEELTEYLCAADLYLQPGSVSATMENAMCCRCAQLLYPTDAYKRAYPKDMAIWVENDSDILEGFKSVCCGGRSIERMRESAYRYALDVLDYRKLAARLYR